MEVITIVIITIILASLCLIAYSNTSSRIHSIQDKYVLVTGCDTGFGRAIAQRLDQLGITVFAACLTHKAVNELQHSSRMIPFVMDVTDNEQINRTVTMIKNKLPSDRGLWGLVNNAGIATGGFIDWISMDVYRKVAEVNLFGLINVTTQFLPLIKKERGRIVNVASVAGVVSCPYAAAYTTSKFGIVGFTGTLRLEMKPFDVSVHCICPAFFRTPITDPAKLINSMQLTYEALSDDVKKYYDPSLAQQMEANIRTMNDAAVTDLNPVVEAIEDALLGTRPKSFYFLGDKAWLWRILCVCPAYITDLFLSKINPLYANYCSSIQR